MTSIPGTDPSAGKSVDDVAAGLCDDAVKAGKIRPEQIQKYWEEWRTELYSAARGMQYAERLSEIRERIERMTSVAPTGETGPPESDALGRVLVGTGKKAPIAPPDWPEMGEYLALPLSDLVALSCDLDPDAIRHRGIGQSDPKFREYMRRTGVATNRSEEIPHTADRRVRLEDFAAWAAKMKWPLPVEFPGQKVGSSVASQSGTVIVDLDSLEKLGNGGFGSVYVYPDPRLNTEFAIKVFDPSPFNGPDARTRFLREAGLLFRLKHDNIVRVFEVGELNDGRPFIKMERFPGRDLYAHEGKLAGDAGSHVIRGLASALEHAHEKGVFHRDIKPSNILVNDALDRVCLIISALAF
jgi:hypothetical protein